MLETLLNIPSSTKSYFLKRIKCLHVNNKLILRIKGYDVIHKQLHSQDCTSKAAVDSFSYSNFGIVFNSLSTYSSRQPTCLH